MWRHDPLSLAYNVKFPKADSIAFVKPGQRFRKAVIDSLMNRGFFLPNEEQIVFIEMYPQDVKRVVDEARKNGWHAFYDRSCIQNFRIDRKPIMLPSEYTLSDEEQKE